MREGGRGGSIGVRRRANTGSGGVEGGGCVSLEPGAER